MAVWTGESKVHELYTVACGLYACWVVLRIAMILYTWIPQGWHAIFSKIVEWSILVCVSLLYIQQQQPFYGPLSGTTRVSRYQKKHSPTHHPDRHPVFISFFHLPRSIAYSPFKLRAWQSFCTTSIHVLFGLPLVLEPSTSYSIHFFTQSVSSSNCSTWPYHHNLFCCSINVISSLPSLSLNTLLGTLSFTLTLDIHLTILISAR